MIGVVASGETAPAADVADALVVLNQMLEAWGAESLSIFTLNISTFNLVGGQQAYTIGTGGNFNTARPARIGQASIISNSNPSQPLELPISLATDEEWQAIPVKLTTSTLPRIMYDDGSFPLRNLSFWPVPTDGSVQVRLYMWSALSQFTDLVTDFSFPPGYMEAIKYNLAVRLAAEWRADLSPLTIQLATDSKARIKSLNIAPIYLRCDDAVVSTGKRFNWLTGQ
jgi:hypothetical protein